MMFYGLRFRVLTLSYYENLIKGANSGAVIKVGTPQTVS